mgnify:CR=1 FL=1
MSGSGENAGMGHGKAWSIKVAVRITVPADKVRKSTKRFDGMGRDTGMICCLVTRRLANLDTAGAVG